MERHQLRAGAFIPPFHPTDLDPTLCYERDFTLVEHLERLGFEEAWIGEHHSGGFETIGAPDLFIAAAAVRTQRIRLGTGVLSLPANHPYIVAARMVQLDHQTRGRAMFGVGPGVLPADSLATGVPLEKTRERMEAALDVIVRLLAGERVSCETDGFSMRDARLQLSPYSHPRPHLAVASSSTPNGGRVAGKYGLGLLCTAVSDRHGFDGVMLNWRIANETAAQFGTTVERSSWRLIAPFHLAETREQALAEVAAGYEKWDRYRRALLPSGSPVIGITNIPDINEYQRGAFGTPDDAVAMLESVWERTGGFGCIVLLDHGWADWAATLRSYELFATQVLPKFAQRNRLRDESLVHAAATGAAVADRVRAAAAQVMERYLEKGQSR